MAEQSQAADGGRRREYVVLARRYRPSRFEDVIGQQHVTRTLQNAIRAGRVHHAYLFTGSRGVGKTTVARILARALNHGDGPTPSPPPIKPGEEDPGVVDVIEIDGASHTGVDNVRELRESVRYLPARSRYKIYIIDEVHMLSTGAFNALLKTLEEPPPHVVFVFATTEPHKIPATILSRCQRFDFKRVPTGRLVEHMQSLLQQEGIAVDTAGLALIARAAEGGVRDSLSLLDQVIAYAASEDAAQTIEAAQVAEVLGVADRRVLFELSLAVLSRDAAAALGVVDSLFRDGHDLSQVAQAFTAHLRDLIVVASCEDPAPLLDATEAEIADLRAQAGSTTLGLLQQHFDRFAHASEEIARSTFPRLLFEMALIELVHAEPLLPLGDLLGRLEDLERRLGSGVAPASTPRGPAVAAGGSGSGGSGSGGSGSGGSGSGGSGSGGSGSGGSDSGSGGSGSGSGGSGSGSGGSGARPAAPVGGPPRRAPLNFEAPAPRGRKPQRSEAPQASGFDHTGGPALRDDDDDTPPIGEPPPDDTPPIGHPARAEVSRQSAPAESPRSESPRHERVEAPPATPPIFARGTELENWQQLLSRVGAPLATTFAVGRLLRWKNGTVELGYPSGAFELNWAQEEKRRRAFSDRCAELLGRPLKVDVRELTPQEESSREAAQLSAAEANAQARREREQTLKEEAEAHPITRSFVETFGAKIMAIHTEVEEGSRG